jgi:hypothetical protein
MLDLGFSETSQNLDNFFFHSFQEKKEKGKMLKNCQNQGIFIGSLNEWSHNQFLPKNGFFGSKATVDRYSLRFEFQLLHSNAILVNTMLQK